MPHHTLEPYEMLRAKKDMLQRTVSEICSKEAAVASKSQFSDWAALL